MAERANGFTPIFDGVAREFGLVGAAVFGIVWRHCQMRHGRCHASIETMANLLGVNERTVRRQLVMLAQRNFIRREAAPTPRVPASYVCLYDPNELLVGVDIESTQGGQNVRSE